MRKTKAQVSIEVIGIISIVMILFSVVILQVMEKNREIGILDEVYSKGVVCTGIANSISEVFSAGAYSQMNLTLAYKYPVTVYGEGGYVVVGNEPNSISCTMPTGMMNHTLSFESGTLSIINPDGLVVIDVDMIVTTTTITTTSSTPE